MKPLLFMIAMAVPGFAQANGLQPTKPVTSSIKAKLGPGILGFHYGTVTLVGHVNGAGLQKFTAQVVNTNNIVSGLAA